MTDPRRQRGARTGGARAAHASPVFLSLPMPPSVNEMFKGLKDRQNRAVSQVYRDWKGHAGWVLRSQNPHRVAGPTVIVANVERNKYRGDIDNREKAILDLLVEHNVIDDDSLCEGVAWGWTRGGNGLCHVAVMPIQHVTLEFHPATENGAPGGWTITAPIIGDDTYGDISRVPQHDESLSRPAYSDLRAAGSRQDVPRSGVSKPGLLADRERLPE